MSSWPKRLTVSVLSLLLAACASPRAEEDLAPSEDEGGVTSRNGAIILSGSTLDDGRGSLLDAMRGKVPNLRIHRSSGQCPQISLRSHVTFETVVEPHVYVDGTRATDTCILESLRGQDVDMVEIYPMGFTTRPGYATHAHGLILVFMRRL